MVMAIVAVILLFGTGVGVLVWRQIILNSQPEAAKWLQVASLACALFFLGCVDISPQADESGSEMKEAKVSGVQLLKPGEDPAVMLYFVDAAFDQMTLPV